MSSYEKLFDLGWRNFEADEAGGRTDEAGSG